MKFVAGSFFQLFLYAVICLVGRSEISRADDWPQWLGPQRDGVWRETGIVDRFPESGPKFRWRTPIGAGYSGPAVADGRVYITDRVLPDGTSNPSNAFSRSAVAGKDRVLCIEESSGKILWNHEYGSKYRVSYAAGPRTTPIVDGERIYTLGTMGELLCLDAKSGSLVWSKNLLNDYHAELPVWGFAAHPLLDGNKLICLGGGSDGMVVAFDKASGKEIWRAVEGQRLGYCPPVIYEIGGKRQLIIWHPAAITGLDPETGKSLWSLPFEAKADLSVPMPRIDSGRIFITSFYNSAIFIKPETGKDSPAIVWKGKGKGEEPTKTQSLHSIMPTPVIKDGHIYGICSYGELRCLKLETGERVWETHKATTGKSTRWGNAFLTPHEDKYFLFNELGDLIIARLSPQGYDEISRTHILEPTNNMPGRMVVWSHPAYAYKSIYARNDKEIVCVSLAAR